MHNEVDADEQLLTDVLRVLGSDHPTPLTARGNLATGANATSKLTTVRNDGPELAKNSHRTNTRACQSQAPGVEQRISRSGAEPVLVYERAVEHGESRKDGAAMVRSVRRGRRPQPNGGGHRGVVWLVNGVLVGVGGVFLTTTSALVTAIAAAAAVVIAVTVIVMAGR